MKYFYRLFSAILVLLISASASADVPAGYYSSLNGKKEGELKSAIYRLVHNFTLISSYQDLPRYFQTTDVYPNSRQWWDMYSNIPLYSPSFSGLNREHSFPKSWWGGSTDVSAYVDLNHLYPSEAAANMAKSNYPLGEVDRNYKVTFENGVSTVGYPVAGQGGGAALVFEPADEYKGDFARTYFYMATCYQDLTWKYTYMVSQNIYPTLNTWSANLLMKWHREDPVSEKEINRNEAVYGFQNNRNPFIDYPELAEYLWGNKVGQTFTPGASSEPAGEPNLITPTQDMALDFGEVALGKSVTRQLFFHGENITSQLDLVLYQGNKAMFSLASKSIKASLVNSEDGYWLNITYTPTELGKHSTRLIVSEGGITGSRGIILNGECLAVPTLSPCVATEATNIQSDSYTANWTAPEGDVIDYYIVTRTKYVNGTATTEELLAEENYLDIDGFNESDKEAYSVQSVRLGYRSDASNVIFVDHAGINGVTTDQPLAVVALDGAIRFTCSQDQTNCRIYDISGKQVNYIPTISHNMDIQMPLGVYFVVTDQHHSPVKVAVR
jgi:hypothetical protein